MIFLLVVKAGAQDKREGQKEKRTPQSPPKFNQ